MLVDGVTIDDDLYATETFGPITGVATFRDFDEAMELANNHGYGLSSSIYTRSGRTRSASASASRAGMVSVNNSTSGAEAHLPFGGNGKSGNGSRQSGIWVLDQFTRWQSMNWDYAGKLQKAQMDVVEVDAQTGLPARLAGVKANTLGRYCARRAGGPSMHGRHHSTSSPRSTRRIGGHLGARREDRRSRRLSSSVQARRCRRLPAHEVDDLTPS